VQWWGAEELSRGGEAGGPSSGIVRIRSMTPVSKWIHARRRAPEKHRFSCGHRPAANGSPGRIYVRAEANPMTQKERTACYTRNRFVKARPAPDFRYCSKFSARLGSTNSIDTISAHGRCAAVAREPPLLCVASRLGTSAVSPT
jgi:hypothetical protein